MKFWKRFCFLGADGGDAGGGDTGGAGDGGGGTGGEGAGQKSIFDGGGSAGDAGAGKEPPPSGEGTGTGGGEGAPQVPESYEFNLGEGLTITDEQKAAFTAIAKDAKLTQGQADSLLKMHSEIVNSYMHEAEAAIEKNIAECEKQGLTTQENLGYAKAAIDMFGGGAAMQALIDTGAINHPAVCKLFVTIGQLISEDKPPDTHIGGSGKQINQSQLADILFPNSKY